MRPANLQFPRLLKRFEWRHDVSWPAVPDCRHHCLATGAAGSGFGCAVAPAAVAAAVVDEVVDVWESRSAVCEYM